MAKPAMVLMLLTTMSPPGIPQHANPKPVARIRFDLIANGIFLPVYVNGKGPLLFELDTGSSNSVVASEAVAGLGLKTTGVMEGMGAGSGSSSMALIPHLELTLPGGLKMSTTDGAAVSMAGLWPLVARRIDGVLGYDVLRRFIVDVDYQNCQLMLYDPATYRHEAGAQSLPFRLWGGYDPQISGEIVVPGEPPIPVQYTIDTGAGGTIVAAPLVRSHHLRESAVRILPSPSHGVGNGESQDLLARLSELRIGPYVVSRPLAALSQDTVGSLDRESLGVNLGGNILRRFRVIIDYPHNRLFLEPNRQFDEPFVSDGSGLVLKADGKDFKTFTVLAVVPDSPASEVGLREGDVIVGVEGHDMAQYALWQVQDLFKGAGRIIQVQIRRAARISAVALNLRSLL